MQRGLPQHRGIDPSDSPAPSRVGAEAHFERWKGEGLIDDKSLLFRYLVRQLFLKHVPEDRFVEKGDTKINLY